MTKKQNETAVQLLKKNPDYSDVIFATAMNSGQFENAIESVEAKYGDDYKLITDSFGCEMYFLIHSK